ncbi:glycosyltransferase family 4 protein [Microbacterium marinum]|uniref:glycosyltransferase family 4 protein n=1 Tax=Microbacterium marinum TaxID=421115 RepID=UPI00384D5ABD
MGTDDTRLRVLHLDHTSASGGAELALLRMLQAEPDWAPMVLTPPTGGGGVFDFLHGHRTGGVSQRAGVASGRIGAVFTGTAGLVAQALSTRLHRAFRTAELVDANSTRAAAYGAMAARMRRVPFVIHLRDTVDVATLGAAGHTVMARVALPRADAVIANSAATLATAAPHLRADALSAVIPSASGLRVGLPRPARNEGPLRVGMLARIDPWKGQHLVLEAFARAFPQGEETLEFAGGAPFGHDEYAASLARAAEQWGLGDRVRMRGDIRDIWPVLAQWDIAVQFSTRPEPLGQNVLQYLAAGCATVVADEGGPIEWVMDGVNGARATARDVDDLARVLRALAADPDLRAQYGGAGAATAGLLDDAAVASAHAAFYREVRIAFLSRTP